MKLSKSKPCRGINEVGVNDGRKFDSPANFVFEFSPHLADETTRAALRTIHVTFHRKRIATAALKGQTECSPRRQYGRHGHDIGRAFNYRGRMMIQSRWGWKDVVRQHDQSTPPLRSLRSRVSPRGNRTSESIRFAASRWIFISSTVKKKRIRTSYIFACYFR